jgi:hypothetical protein
MASSSSLMSSPSWLVGKLALPPLMRRRLCRCCYGDCCSHHDGVIAAVDAQVCLRHCQASIVALTACCQAGSVTHVLMVLLPSMRRVFSVVTIAIFALMTMALSPLLMHRHPCYCGDGVFALVTMALLPLGSQISCPALPWTCRNRQNNWQIW